MQHPDCIRAAGGNIETLYSEDQNMQHFYGDEEMPTPECWQDIGRNFGLLAAKIDALKDGVELRYEKADRDILRIEQKFTSELSEIKADISGLKLDKASRTAIIAFLAILLPGIGVVFSEPLHAIGKNLFR